MLTSFKRKASLLNYKFGFIHKQFGNKHFKLLDIGCGNHSPSKTKFIFPNCEYYGLDLDKTYNNDAKDFEVTKAFYELDLTKLDYSIIPDNFFDFIRMAHVIEHLYNGDEVLKALLPKLKKGGFFYIEYPGKKSLKLPSMHGTLNFHDDPTHVRLYSVEELRKIFEAASCKVLRAGTRRNVWNILAMPARAMLSILKNKKIEANIFWDITGFAEYLFVKKIAS
jgi:SAM-dependent methyltransferase